MVEGLIDMTFQLGEAQLILFWEVLQSPVKDKQIFRLTKFLLKEGMSHLKFVISELGPVKEILSDIGIYLVESISQYTQEVIQTCCMVQIHLCLLQLLKSFLHLLLSYLRLLKHL